MNSVIKSFTRENFYGENFPWYGIDEIGQIAEFVTGELPIPSLIFTNEKKYNRVRSFFEHLPDTTTSLLTDKFLEIKQKSGGMAHFTVPLRRAAKGLYSISEYDEPGWFTYTAKYALMAFPEEPLNINKVPNKIKDLVTAHFFSGVNFHEVTELKVENYFKCDY